MATSKEKKAPADKKAPKKKAAPKAASAAAASTEAKTKKFQEYTIVTKRSGRYEVLAKNGKNVNGLDKAKVLVAAKLVKTGIGKKEGAAPPAAPSEEAPPAAS